MSTFIVIPYFRAPHLLSRLLLSLQTEREFFKKVLIVDDSPNCSDLAKICKDHDYVEIIKNKENLGFGKTCNLGVTVAIEQGAKYLLLLNQDTKVHPGLVEKLIKGLKSEQKNYITAPLSCDYILDEIEPFFIDWYLHKSHDLIQDLLAKRKLKKCYYVEDIHAACIAFRASLIQGIGLFDPIYQMYSEDRDFCRRVQNCAGKIALIPEAKISHLHSHASGLSKKMQVIKYESDLIFILKNPKSKFSTNFKKTTSFFLKSIVDDFLNFRLRDVLRKLFCFLRVLKKGNEIKTSQIEEKRIIKTYNKKMQALYYDGQIEISRGLLENCYQEIPKVPGEIRLFAHFRNEELRLPYFFDYYTRLGVDRFFVIDNSSTDKTLEILQKQKNTHIFRTSESMHFYNFWLDILLKDYGMGHWCIVADADEIFTFPGSDKLSLKEFCNFLDLEGSNALHSLLLDMYSELDLKKVDYHAGEEPLRHCSYFDPEILLRDTFSKNRRTYQGYQMQAYHGGMRERVFKARYNMSKIPLLKYSEEMLLGEGHHIVTGAKLSESQGLVFHFKYFQDFIERSFEEAKREEHFMNGADYKQYAKIIAQNPELNLHFEGSLKYQNLAQLETLGFIRYAKNLKKRLEKIS